MSKRWEWFGRVADGLSLGQLIWSIFSGGAVLAILFSWLASTWAVIAREGIGAIVIVGVGLTCFVILTVSAFLAAWRYFRPLRVSPKEAAPNKTDREQGPKVEPPPAAPSPLPVVASAPPIPPVAIALPEWPTLGLSRLDEPVHVGALIIVTNNHSDMPIRLEEAYVQSGLTGEKQPLRILIPRGGLADVSEINAIPPGALINLQTQFYTDESQSLGIVEQRFFELWGKLDVVVKYDGITVRRTYGEHALNRALDNQDPGRKWRKGPRVTKRP